MLDRLRTLFKEDLNFLLTNRVPRRLLTRLAGWYARIESPALTRLSLAVWSQLAGDLHLEECERQQFVSVHDCFTRKLREGARHIAPDADTVVSPCDGIVGAVGRIERGAMLQAKGMPYQLHELVGDEVLSNRHAGGAFVTLRLRSNMYHRFHAPCDALLRRVRYISGDTWNVNPIAVKRIERLFCRNERAVLEFALSDSQLALTLVPVAAILVASIRLHALPFPLDLEYRGATVIDCDANVRKGEELGYFENGSTIIVLAAGGFERCSHVTEGATLQMGQPLFRFPQASMAGSAHHPDTLGESHD